MTNQVEQGSESQDQGRVIERPRVPEISQELESATGIQVRPEQLVVAGIDDSTQEIQSGEVPSLSIEDLIGQARGLAESSDTWRATFLIRQLRMGQRGELT